MFHKQCNKIETTGSLKTEQNDLTRMLYVTSPRSREWRSPTEYTKSPISSQKENLLGIGAGGAGQQRNLCRPERLQNKYIQS